MQNPLVSYTIDGTYNVSLTATNQFGSGTVIKTGYVVINLTDVTENQFVLTLSITPNPSSGKIVVSDYIPGTIIRIMDLNGRVVFEKKSTEETMQIETSGFSKGLLLIEAYYPATNMRSVSKIINQ